MLIRFDEAPQAWSCMSLDFEPTTGRESHSDRVQPRLKLFPTNRSARWPIGTPKTESSTFVAWRRTISTSRNSIRLAGAVHVLRFRFPPLSNGRSDCARRLGSHTRLSPRVLASRHRPQARSEFQWHLHRDHPQ